MFDDQRKPYTLPFQVGEVKKLITEIVPDIYPIHRQDNIRYRIESKWKTGSLTKLLVDDIDITHTIVKSNAQERIENVLRMTRDYKPYYTGTVRFDVEKENGIIVMVYVVRSHFAITKQFAQKAYRKEDS